MEKWLRKDGAPLHNNTENEEFYSDRWCNSLYPYNITVESHHMDKLMNFHVRFSVEERHCFLI